MPDEYMDTVKQLRQGLARERQALAKVQGDFAANLDDRGIRAIAQRTRARFWGFDEWSIAEQKAAIAESFESLVLDGKTILMKVKAGLPVPKAGSLRDRYIELIESSPDLSWDEAYSAFDKAVAPINEFGTKGDNRS
jgi:hypothetical protein